jgi:hypothetical protein
MNPGDIILVPAGSGILSRLIKFFGRSKWSHVAIEAGRLACGKLGAALVFEADLLCKLTFFNTVSDSPIGISVYSWRPDWLQHLAADEAFQLARQLDGKEYGILSLTWYPWRWLVEKLHLPRRWAVHNWLPGGTVCTEIACVLLDRLATLEAELRSTLAIQQALTAMGYDSNAVTPLDIQKVCESLVNIGYMDATEI